MTIENPWKPSVKKGMKRKVKLLALIPAMLLTLTVVLTLLTGAAHAYKLAVDVPLSNGHKVTVQFADNFPRPTTSPQR